MSTLVLKSPLKKLPIPLITITICAFCFLIFSYTERISSLSSNSRPSIKHALEKSTKDVKTREDLNDGVDNGLEFDQNTFSVNENDGTWKFNSSFKPLYTESSCPYLDKQVTCTTNGRTDSDYWHWEWQPDDYILPRFDPKIALEKLRGKKLMFVGDSLQRGQWQSFVCLVQSIIPEGKKSMKRALPLSVFRAEEYNATVEFFWAPFIIESNNDLKGNSSTRILRIDSVAKHAKHWLDVDILVFNTYLWWMNGKTIKSLWGSFANGEEGYEELDATVSYHIALKTWANWVDSIINTNKTRVFFTTMSPAHQWSTDWNNVGGIKCFNETKPVTKKGHWGTGSDKRMMKIVSQVLDKMKVPVTVLNITQLSEYRIDAHSSIYTETRGKLLTAEQRADPLHFADCVHWCLPGVPDTWNQIFLAQLL